MMHLEDDGRTESVWLVSNTLSNICNFSFCSWHYICHSLQISPAFPYTLLPSKLPPPTVIVGSTAHHIIRQILNKSLHACREALPIRYGSSQERGVTPQHFWVHASDVYARIGRRTIGRLSLYISN